MRRVAIVTGGGRGIGAEIAQVLAAANCVVAVADIDGANASATAAALAGSGHIGITLDVSDEGAVEAAFERVELELGPVAVLVCAAGKLLLQDGRRPLITETALGNWQEMLAVNTTGPFLCARAMLRRRTDNPVPNGRIVTFSSCAAQLGGYNASAAYIAAKAAVLGLTKAIAREAAPLGITANAIAPGIIDTEMLRLAAGGAGKTPANPAAVPLGRIGTAREVADAVGFLVSEAASYVTGTTMDVNGGYRMQ